MAKRWLTYAISGLLLACAPLRADSKKPATAADCTGAVKGAVSRAFPKSTIAKCKAEREHDRFEVKLVKADGARVEIDVAGDGRILQIEEAIPVDRIPAAVMKAFAARYPEARVSGAEKQSPTGGTPSYELAFEADGKQREATFAEDGKLVEEE